MKTDFRGRLQPQLEEGIKKAEWKSKEEISQLLDNAYENIKIHFEQKRGPILGKGSWGPKVNNLHHCELHP